MNREPGIFPIVTDTSEIPAWVAVVDELALAALRTHLQVEFDLRAVLRSKASPEDVLERAERILDRAVNVTKRGVVMSRALILMNRFDLGEGQKRLLAEQVAAMHLLLLARLWGWSSVSYFRKNGGADAVEVVGLVGGLIPSYVDLEADTSALFEVPRIQEGIPAA